jgi:hypothetical protein
MSQASPQRLPHLLLGLSGAIVVLTGFVTVVGAFPWPRPRRVMTSFWQVSDVPGALWALVLGTAAVCVVAAAVLTIRGVGLEPREPAVLAWLALLLLAAAALVWSALYAAALSATFYGAIIPIFHWLFTFVPAMVAGGFFGRRARRMRLATALGTGVVTVPLFHLFSVLLVRPGRPVEAVLSSMPLTAFLAVVPLVIGILLAGAAPGASDADVSAGGRR